MDLEPLRGLVVPADDPAHAAQTPQARTPHATLPPLLTLYLRDVRRFGRLTAQDEARLARAHAGGDAAAGEALLCHHLGLVIAMARSYRNRGLDLLDLIGEGNLGMLVALGKFEVGRGLRFSTYAAWWIRHFLQTAIAMQVPIVRPPLRLQRLARQRAWSERDQDGGHDTAAVTSVALEDLELGRNGLHGVPVAEDPAAELSARRDGPRILSHMTHLLAELPPQQREVLVARFGLGGGTARTLQDIGTEKGLSRERVRQIQALALDSLRRALEHTGITPDAVLE